MGNSLKNRVAVVTGAGKGLGKTFALALAAEGVHLALIGRNADTLNEVADAARQSNVTAEVFTGDVSREQDVRRIEQEIIDKYKKIHILINNAGINIRKNV